MSVRSSNASVSIGIPRRDPCSNCGLPVFIAERLNIGKQLYHRTCFRCARCNSQLNLENYYETETENQFCCKTCPDEEQIRVVTEQHVITRSLSDEEKSAGIKLSERDQYSEVFESSLNYYDISSKSSDQSIDYNTARSHFINKLLSQDDIPPDLPKSEPPTFDSTAADPGTKNNYFESDDSVIPSSPDSSVNNVSVSASSLNNQLKTASRVELDQNNDIVTKENVQENSSLVQARMRLFQGISSVPSKPTNFLKPRKKLDVGIEEDPLVQQSPSKENTTEVIVVDSSDSYIVISDDSKNSAENVAEVSSTKEENIPESEIDDTSNHALENESNNFINANLTPPEVKFKDTINFINDNNEIKQNLEVEDENLEANVECKNEELITECNNDALKQNTKFNNEEANSELVNQNSTPSKSNSELTTPNSDLIIEDSNQTEEVLNQPEEEEEEYPDHLNPFGDENEDAEVLVHEKSLNPFSEDEDEEPVISSEPKLRKIIPRISEYKLTTGSTGSTPEMLKKISIDRKSILPENEPYNKNVNPFLSDDEDNEKRRPIATPRKNTTSLHGGLRPNLLDSTRLSNSASNVSSPASQSIRQPRKINPHNSEYKLTTGSTGCTPDFMKNIKITRISIPSQQEPINDSDYNRNNNPFWSDDEDNEERTSIAAPNRNTSNHQDQLKPSFGSLSSFSSSASSVPSSTRKKKAAPRPPIPFDPQESPQNSLTSSPSSSVHHSPRPRKSKRAPLPPMSTPFLNKTLSDPNISPIFDDSTTQKSFTSSTPSKTSVRSPTSSLESEYEKEKVFKDESNRNKQILSNSYELRPPNKSVYGKWKRKKGQAPTRPVLQKRTIKALPIVEVKRELDTIEIQLQGLEKQGVRLEQIIREHCEGPNSSPDDVVTIEAEDLILQLFEVVNEKNEICRRQAELVYLQRSHRLEEEHAEVEYQIRCLMLQPEATKTDSDKSREEKLINRLVEIVEKRNEIIECLEMDRVREAAEDDSILNSMNTYATKRDENNSSDITNNSPKKKEKKKFRKKFKLHSSHKVDVDKDIDECESSNSSTISKDKKKKKFNIF